ncbi:MAG: FtsB family cell division protein [Alphaproteobacteria bacterium]
MRLNVSLFSELRLRARHIIGPVLGICATGYFAFHAINGDRGLLALRQLSQQVSVAQADFDQIRTRRQALEDNVRLLSPDSLDPDMLDERARRMLNFGYGDEIVVVTDVTVILPERIDLKEEQRR